MTSTTQITRMRRRRNERIARNPAPRLGIGCGFIGALIIAAGFLVTAVALTTLMQGIPSIENFSARLEPPDGALLAPTRLYDRTGDHVLAELRNSLSTERIYLYLEGDTSRQLIPTTVVSATLAASDPTFWRHPGFTIAGLFQQEHRTLAQRLVSDLLLPDQPHGWRRNVQERLLAFQLTTRFGREKVLEWYLNSANYAHLAIGIQAASQLYLDKPAASLSLAEAALLAGIPDAPHLNPLDNPLAAMQGQKQVILKMLDFRLIDPESGIQAVREQVLLRGPLSSRERYLLQAPQNDLAPAFTRLALSQLEGQFSRVQLERGGLRVITTLDYSLLQDFQCFLRYQEYRIQNTPDTLASVSEQCPALAFLPAPASAEDAPQLSELEIEILDPHSGQILFLAQVPEPGHQTAAFLEHPAGTLATPFIYLSAFTQGFSPASLAWDIPAGDSPSLSPSLDGQFHGPVRLRTALVNDYLAPAAQLMSRFGETGAVRISQQIGFLPAGYAAVPGSQPYELFGNVGLVQATQAYGVFANQGTRAGRRMSAGRPSSTLQAGSGEIISTAVLRLEDAEGNILLDWSEPDSQPILTPQLAYLVTDILADEPARWPSLGNPNYLEIDRPAAVKIGRSPGQTGNWVLGYTPQLAVGLWAGSETESPAGTPSVQTSSRHVEAAIGLWSAVARTAHRENPAENWTVPQGLEFIEVCEPSGMLPDTECPAIVKEVFLEGNGPVQQDTLFQTFQVNQSSGLLASLFTPPDLLEQRVFMVVPPEARQWARSSGLQLPPENYDAIPEVRRNWENASIQSPAMFDVVRGIVPVTGTASGLVFSQYRLQVGQGLSPQTWWQVGGDSTRVVDEELAQWDTAGLDGLFALQLLVIQQDKEVQRSTVLVTVDNQSPTVKVVAPSEGDRLSSDVKPELLIQLSAEDNLRLDEVSVYLDGKLLVTLTNPPYAFFWQVVPGEHMLKAVAVDQAGNQAQHSIQFFVQ